MSGEGLTVKERILLHLRDTKSVEGHATEASTQAGIAKGVGIRRSHVPRAVKKLVEDGSLDEVSVRLPGKTRKVKAYTLTDVGLKIGNEIRNEIGKRRIVIRGVEETEMTIREARMAFDMTTLEILGNLVTDNVLEIPEEEVVEEIGFLNRKEELSEMRNWLKGRTSFLVMYSPEGFGKTQLARHFLKNIKKYDILWKDLSEDDSTYEIFNLISDYLATRGRKRAQKQLDEGDIDKLISILPEEMASIRSIYVFDNWFHVGEDIVDLFSYLARNSTKLGSSKILVLAREATPSYCRFYTKEHVERAFVKEMHLKGLDEESSKALLENPDIDEEAFRRIYLLTKGCPLYLRLIRDGNEEELKRCSRFSTPEIKLLIFSSRVKGKHFDTSL